MAESALYPAVNAVDEIEIINKYCIVNHIKTQTEKGEEIFVMRDISQTIFDQLRKNQLSAYMVVSKETNKDGLSETFFYFREKGEPFLVYYAPPGVTSEEETQFILNGFNKRTITPLSPTLEAKGASELWEIICTNWIVLFDEIGIMKSSTPFLLSQLESVLGSSRMMDLTSNILNCLIGVECVDDAVKELDAVLTQEKIGVLISMIVKYWPDMCLNRIKAKENKMALLKAYCKSEKIKTYIMYPFAPCRFQLGLVPQFNLFDLPEIIMLPNIIAETSTSYVACPNLPWVGFRKPERNLLEWFERELEMKLPIFASFPIDPRVKADLEIQRKNIAYYIHQALKPDQDDDAVTFDSYSSEYSGIIKAASVVDDLPVDMPIREEPHIPMRVVASGYNAEEFECGMRKLNEEGEIRNEDIEKNQNLALMTGWLGKLNMTGKQKEEYSVRTMGTNTGTVETLTANQSDTEKTIVAVIKQVVSQESRINALERALDSLQTKFQVLETHRTSYTAPLNLDQKLTKLVDGDLIPRAIDYKPPDRISQVRTAPPLKTNKILRASDLRADADQF